MARKRGFFERLATKAAHWSGSPWAFALALGTILVWLATGPLFDYSDTWQLIINTGTTIITFLMVFLIQHAQNKDSMAVHLKLNEIVASIEGASNRLINIEDLSDEEIQILHRYYRHLTHLAKSDNSLTHSHSVEEAASRHRMHQKARQSGSK